MPRSGEQARASLEAAALELYAAQGYDETTTAEIAERAGVTVRTFFRHFADKREVFFAREAESREAVRQAIAAVPAEFSPLAAITAAFRTRIPHIESWREFSTRRHHVISATPALREREAAKFIQMSAELAEALTARGVSVAKARLWARVVIDVQAEVLASWMQDPDSDLATLFTAALVDLREFIEG